MLRFAKLSNKSKQTVFFKFTFCSSLSVWENLGHLNWTRRSSRKSSATQSYRCLQNFHVSKQWRKWQCFGFSTCAQMMLHVIGGCTDTVRESAPQVDSGRTIPCYAGHWKTNQYCAWFLCRMLYQLIYPRP